MRHIVLTCALLSVVLCTVDVVVAQTTEENKYRERYKSGEDKPDHISFNFLASHMLTMDEQMNREFAMVVIMKNLEVKGGRAGEILDYLTGVDASIASGNKEDTLENACPDGRPLPSEENLGNVYNTIDDLHDIRVRMAYTNARAFFSSEEFSSLMLWSREVAKGSYYHKVDHNKSLPTDNSERAIVLQRTCDRVRS